MSVVIHHPHHSPVHIRPALPGDLGAVLEIERASFAHAGERFGEHTTRTLIRSTRAIAAVAESDGNLLGWGAGFGSLRKSEPHGTGEELESDTPWGRVYALAIRPEARGRKLGEKLLHYLIGELRARGARRIFLEVRTDNHAAVKLYEKVGFVVCQPLAHYYGQGIPGQRMRLDVK